MARILFLCDKPNWAFHITASNLSQRIKKHQFDIKFVSQHDTLDPTQCDLIYVFWWGEKYHRRFDTTKIPVVKEISSHRWEYQPDWFVSNPREAAWCYLHDADAVVATSKRLAASFAKSDKNVFHYPLGIDSTYFRPGPPRSGPLVVGWAGNKADPLKRYDTVFVPATSDFPHALTSPDIIPHQEMGDWYRQLDIICITSIAEGTPLPLIEAMACGAFPISTDVGVATELIQDGRNGILFDGSVAGLRSALQWCTENAEIVRAAGQYNSELIANTRTWDQSAKRFEEILDEIMNERTKNHLNRISGEKDSAEPPHQTTQSLMDGKSYSAHFNRINDPQALDGAYTEACKYFFEDLRPLLPENKASLILEVGTGHGHLLKYLLDSGYHRIHGVDRSEDLLKVVAKRLGGQAERLDCADALDFLARTECRYDFIFAFDVFEHFPVTDGLRFLQLAKEALRPNGTLVMRTPNMANLLGSYSLYMDLTHRHGYTAWTLRQMLEDAGFATIKEHYPKIFWNKKRKLRSTMNTLLHQMFYRLNDRAPAEWYGKNLVFSASP